jgi:hypothetical protein
LQKEALEAENMQLRSLVRKLEQESEFAEVFEVYERDMGRVGAELRRLRDENLMLSER